jgi:hypothetical protein
VNFSGRVNDPRGGAISGFAGVTFAIYGEQSGGALSWIETQSVVIDAKGDYVAQLCAATSAGLLMELFASDEARWRGVRLAHGNRTHIA